MRRYVNLGAYMNAASYTVMENCPLTRAFKLFRNLGSRPLPSQPWSPTPYTLTLYTLYTLTPLHPSPTP